MAEASGTIRILIVDEHPIVREALRVLIEAVRAATLRSKELGG